MKHFKIHVVQGPEEKFQQAYMLRILTDIWAQQGHTVTTGPVSMLDADIGMAHIDRTWVPESFLPENPSDLPVLNGRVLDISKRHVSKLILQPDSVYDGPVIIKTNANYYGLKETRKSSLAKFIRRQHLRLAKLTSWQTARTLPSNQYPVVDHASEVPSWVWRDKDLVVERFAGEKEGSRYVLRLWMFFGDREYALKLYSRLPVIKSDAVTDYEYIDDIPDEIRQERKRLGFDFGKFDFVISDGVPHLIDANKTPYIRGTVDKPSENLLNLAEGLGDILGR